MEPEKVITVLLVEDDTELSSMLVELLRVFGIETKRAVHGQAALEMLHQDMKPDLILLDWYLPVLSGDEFLEVKKNDPRIQQIPVVVMSGAKDIRQILQNRREVQTVLEKPVGIDEIVRSIRSVLLQHTT